MATANIAGASLDEDYSMFPERWRAAFHFKAAEVDVAAVLADPCFPDAWPFSATDFT